jgi:hypothetical protein
MIDAGGRERKGSREEGEESSPKKLVKIAAKLVEAVIINMMIICRRAACATSAPPRMAPVIMPGIEIMPSTLNELRSANNGRCETGEEGSPHVVDRIGQGKSQGFDDDGPARFCS